MDQLPQELIDQICANLNRAEDLRNVYYVSSKFRKAAEEHARTFWVYTYDLNPENKQDFIAYFSNFRLRYLKHVKFDIRYPDLDGAGLSCRESVDERREKDKMFTAQIRDLFATLKLVEERAGERNRGKYQLTLYGPIRRRSAICLHREYDYWRTHLLEPETLPHLMSVVSFEIDAHKPRQPNDGFAKLDYRIPIDLIPRFPRLEELVCRIGHGEFTPDYENEPRRSFPWDFDGPRRDTRHDFGKAIALAKIPQSLKRIELDFITSDDLYQWAAKPDLVSPASKDPFSTGLRILSSHLREMRIRAQLDETLFWPEDGSTPIWPNLHSISIRLHIVSPSGAWYFEGPRGEGRDLTGYEINESSYPPLVATEEDEWLDNATKERDRYFDETIRAYFRISPNENILGPFLKSFAKAAANMPKLTEAKIWSPLKWDVDGTDEDYEMFEWFDSGLSDYQHQYRHRLAWGFVYNSPQGQTFRSDPEEEEDCATRKIWWHVGDWRPNPEIHALFRKIGCEKHGEALKEYWDSDVAGHGLVAEGRFYFMW